MSNKLVLTGLAAALTVSVVSALSISEANQTQPMTSSPANQSIPDASSPTSKTQETSTTDSADAVKVGDNQSSKSQVEDQDEMASDQPSAIAEIHSYEKDGRPAATLYVRDIPVVTFLGSEKSATPTTTKVAATQSEATDRQDPVWRATTVAAKINQFDRDGINADKIQVSWDEKRDSYVIKTEKDHILEMSELTILPETTKDMGDDALRITNLLRRQIGDAKPLTDIPGRPKAVVATAPVSYQINGEASWYGPGFHGNYTANGEVYNQNSLTAAHKTLPFGTRVRVTNLYNGRSVVVRINDRGPFIPGRVIDLSQGAAQIIGVTSSGVAPVQMDILQ